MGQTLILAPNLRSAEHGAAWQARQPGHDEPGPEAERRSALMTEIARGGKRKSGNFAHGMKHRKKVF